MMFCPIVSRNSGYGEIILNAHFENLISRVRECEFKRVPVNVQVCGVRE